MSRQHCRVNSGAKYNIKTRTAHRETFWFTYSSVEKWNENKNILCTFRGCSIQLLNISTFHQTSIHTERNDLRNEKETRDNINIRMRRNLCAKNSSTYHINSLECSIIRIWKTATKQFYFLRWMRKPFSHSIGTRIAGPYWFSKGSRTEYSAILLFDPAQTGFQRQREQLKNAVSYLCTAFRSHYLLVLSDFSFSSSVIQIETNKNRPPPVPRPFIAINNTVWSHGNHNNKRITFCAKVNRIRNSFGVDCLSEWWRVLSLLDIQFKFP